MAGDGENMLGLAAAAPRLFVQPFMGIVLKEE